MIYNIDRKTKWIILISICLLISVIANATLIKAVYRATDTFDHYNETLKEAWHTLNGTWSYTTEQHEAIENLTVMMLVYQMHFMKNNITPPNFDEVFDNSTMGWLWEHYPPNERTIMYWSN